MKVNIITFKDGWILERFGKELAKRLPYVTLNKKRLNKFDINYYINYSLFKNKTDAIDICFFTHLEDNVPILKKLFFKNARKADFNISMSRKYQEILEKNGIKNVAHITPGIDVELYKPKIILGYVGRFYNYTDRKGKDILNKISKLDFVELRTTEGRITEKDMPKFYRELDYVIVPSKVEGGPMCLLEGLACGIPIIAPKDVGMVAEFERGIYHYKNSDYKSLKNLLSRLYKEKLKMRKQIEKFTWGRFANEHNNLFKKLIKNNTHL